jgi:hypothetical protein
VQPHKEQLNLSIQNDKRDNNEDEEVKEEDNDEGMLLQDNFIERPISCKSRSLGQHFRNQNA